MIAARQLREQLAALRVLGALLALDRRPFGVAAHAATSRRARATISANRAVQPPVGGQLGMERRHQHAPWRAATGWPSCSASTSTPSPTRSIQGARMNTPGQRLRTRRPDRPAPRSWPPGGRRRCAARRGRSGRGSAGRAGRRRRRGRAGSCRRRCRTAAPRRRAGRGSAPPARRRPSAWSWSSTRRPGSPARPGPSSSSGPAHLDRVQPDVGAAPARARGTPPGGRARRPYQPRVWSSPSSPRVVDLDARPSARRARSRPRPAPAGRCSGWSP